MQDDESMNVTDEQQAGGESYGEGTGAEYADAAPKGPNRTMLIVLGVVLAGAAIFYVTKKSGSASAKGEDQSVAAKQAIDQFLTSGNDNVRAMQVMLHNTEKLVQRFSTFPNASQVPLADLHTNPFRLKAAAAKTNVDDDAAAKKKQEEERQAALKAVQTLQLQSIVYGDARRACMINGELLQEGQELGTFTVEKIRAEAVVVKTGVYRFELRLQK